MIGQETLKKYISEWKIPPKFIILKGEKGTGRNTAIDYMVSVFKYPTIECPIRAEELRELINYAYVINKPSFFIIRNGSEMSGTSAASLLKVTEEPPVNAFFIIRCENNILSTLKSRSFFYEMSPYIATDIENFCMSHNRKDVYDIYKNLIHNLGQAKSFMDSPLKDIEDYCNLIVKYIGETNLGNVLKITDKINVDDDTSKWDMNVFLSLLENIFLEQIRKNKSENCFQAIFNIQQLKNNLRINGINKSNIFDNFLIDLKNAMQM